MKHIITILAMLVLCVSGAWAGGPVFYRGSASGGGATNFVVTECPAVTNATYDTTSKTLTLAGPTPTETTLWTYTVSATNVTVVHYAYPPAGYRALELQYNVGSTTNAAVDSIGVTLNLDSGANYDRIDLSASAAGAGTYNTTSATSLGNIEICGGTSTNNLTYCTTRIFDYDNTAKWKVAEQNSVSFPTTDNSSWSRNLGMNRWRNLAAVTNITWSVGGGPSFSVGSKFSIKGVRW